MGEIRFLKHYQYRQLVNKVNEVGCFPQCERHPLCKSRILAYFHQLHSQGAPISKLDRSMEALALFIAYYSQQPFWTPLEMLHGHEFSRFICDFVPLFVPEAKNSYERLKSVFDELVGYFFFLHEKGVLKTISPILSAQKKIFDSGRINRLNHSSPRGPEWAVLIPSKSRQLAIAFSYNDFWLAVICFHDFDGNLKAFSAKLDCQKTHIIDRLKKHAQLARLSAKLKKHQLNVEDILSNVDSKGALEKANLWLKAGKFVEDFSRVSRDIN